MRALVLSILLMGALPGVAVAQSGDAAAGRTAAQTWCVTCHVIDRNPATARDSVPPFPAIADRANVTADALRTFLAEPHGRMPTISLSRNEIDNLVAHILSLRAR